MELIIIKTSIATIQNVQVVRPIFNNHPSIISWSVDTEDVDNVLRVEVLGEMTEEDLIGLTKACGFDADVLPDFPYVNL